MRMCGKVTDQFPTSTTSSKISRAKCHKSSMLSSLRLTITITQMDHLPHQSLVEDKISRLMVPRAIEETTNLEL